MEKRIKKVRVDFDFNWTYGVDLKRLKEDIETLEKLGVTEIEIEAENNYGNPSVEIEAFIHRIETDKEFNDRVNKENQHKEEIKRLELEQLKKLKSKYGL